MLVKIMAKILLWDREAGKVFRKDRAQRTSEEQLQVFKLKNRQDDILNTLMFLIKEKANVSLLKDFDPFDSGEESGLLLMATIRLAIRLAELPKGKKSNQQKYIFWACDTKQVNGPVWEELRTAVENVDFGDYIPICMIYPTSKNHNKRYQYNDTEQLAMILPESKKLFCSNLRYAGKSGWSGAYIVDRTDNERYSLYEPLHVLQKLGITPSKVKFIGYNLQRMENTLLRFALAVGADVLILKHPDMSRFRTIMYDNQWSVNDKVREISSAEINSFLKTDNGE